MEDIYQFILNQRHIIENKYYELKSQYIMFNDLDINNINEYYENLSNKEINKDPNNLYFSDNDIHKLLETYDDGIYGIINYYPNFSNDKLFKYIKRNEMSYHNKESIVNKLIKNNKFTEDAINEYYGIVFMYEKDNKEINDLSKVYLLKNGDIQNINEDVEDEKVLTKIYEFGKKITLKEIIYDTDENDEIINLLEPLYKINKKYKKYLDENIKSSELRDTLNNFSFIKNLLRKISDPSKKTLSVQDVMKYNFMDKLTKIKISNRLDKSEYDVLIEKYFDENIIKLTDDMIESYDIDGEFKPYLYILFEILIRIYIDNHLGNKSYCLSKNLTEYFNFSTLFSEPTTLTISLKRRYWNQLLETKDTKKILSSLLMLINNKTESLDMTLKYLESLYQNKSQNNQINDY